MSISVENGIAKTAYRMEVAGSEDPDETEDRDRRHALATARQMRLDRAWLEDAVAAGTIALDALLGEQAGAGRCDAVKVVVLAQKVPGVGKVRSRRAMKQVGIADDARFGEVDRAVLRALWSAMADAAARPL